MIKGISWYYLKIDEKITQRYGLVIICGGEQYMNRSKLGRVMVVTAAITLSGLVGCGSAASSAEKSKSVTIINVSYDPTRELYEEYNQIFREHWKEAAGEDVEIIQSHGGSGKQAL